MARHTFPATALAAFLAFGASGSCLAEGTVVATAAAATPTPGSLYERLGGTEKMTAVVSDTLDRMSTGPHTKRSFDRVNLKRVKSTLVVYICSLTGGGCTYDGDTMKEVHGGHQITNAEFYQLVEVLRESMRKHDVPLGARNELLAILAPMKREVVER